MLGMKAFGHGVLLKSKTITPAECLQYALNLPVATVITGIDSKALLMQAVDIASSFRPLSEEAVQRILSRTLEAAREGKYELFKTSTRFDATAKHPEWLGEELPYVQQLAGD